MVISKNNKIVLIIAAWLITAGLGIFFWKAPNFVAEAIYAECAYYFLMALTAWAAFYILSFRGEVLAWVKSSKLVLATAALGALVVGISVPQEFRVLSDETNLISVSQNFFLRHQAYNPTQNKFYYENLQPLTQEVEKRPLLYPFITHFLHLLRGYDYKNAFYTNLIVLFVLLSLAGSLASRQWGVWGGLAAQFLVLAEPIATLSAASGGFDLLATTLTFSFLTLTYFFMLKPTPVRMQGLILLALSLAHSRYESFLLVGVVGLGLLIFRMFKLQDILASFKSWVLAPFFFLPLIAQRKLTPTPYENKPGESPFGLEHFWRNASDFFNAHITFDFRLPFAVGLHWVGLLGLIFILIRHRKSLSGVQAKFTWLIAGVFFFQLFLYWLYYFGLIGHPSSARFFLFTSLVLSLGALGWLDWLKMNQRAFAGTIVAALFFVAYHPTAAQAKFPHEQNLIRETIAYQDYLARHPDKHVLCIDERPGQIGALGFGSVDFHYANAHWDDLASELSRHLYREILVFQKIAYKDQTPLESERFDEKWKVKLETLEETQVTAEEFLRISKVVHD